MGIARAAGCRNREKGETMGSYLLISDAAKEVKVESHVLRYWEEELHLPIKRNELGHRYYTREDVERFKQIKSMKERGLQLKAIKMILKDGKLDLLPEGDEKGKQNRSHETAERSGAIHELEEDAASKDAGTEQNTSYAGGASAPDSQESEWEGFKGMAIDIVEERQAEVIQESRENKARRLQWLLQQLIRETLQENNRELCREIKESVVKELDYQFRAQEERQEEREKLQQQRSEEYYQRMDELLRRKSRLRRSQEGIREKAAKEKQEVKKNPQEQINTSEVEDALNALAEKGKKKKKRHFNF